MSERLRIRSDADPIRQRAGLAGAQARTATAVAETAGVPVRNVQRAATDLRLSSPRQSCGDRAAQIALVRHIQGTHGNHAAQRLLRASAPYGSIQRAPKPLKYDFSTHTLKPLAAGTTLADVNLKLKGKITAGKIKSFTATGVTAGSVEELFVLDALWNLAETTQWGYEADILAPIGWPAKAGDPAPLGRITVRIDDQGAARVELVASGPVPAPTQTTVAAASPKLIADFKLLSVRDDGTAKWTDTEISDVAAALALVPKGDKLVLEGAELIRVQSLPDNAIASFEAGGGVAKNATSVTQLPSLKISDRAFPATPSRFVGGKPKTVPSTLHSILHEVGHAASKAVFRPADAAYDQAIIESNKKGAALKQSAADYKKAFADYTALYQQYQTAQKAGDTKGENELADQLRALKKTMDALVATNKAQSVANKKAEAAVTAKKAAVAKTRVGAAVVAPFKTDAAAKKAAADAALRAARLTLKTMSGADVTSSAAYVKAVEDTSTAIDTFAADAGAMTGGTTKLEATVLAQAAARQKARDALTTAFPANPALTTLAPVETAQDAWLETERALAGAQRRTLRLQKFINLVTTNKIDRFTDYSAANWRLLPEEFYAEAYGLWLTDPEFLMNNYKVVYNFFQSGDYRK
jgi:hypothetical protein